MSSISPLRFTGVSSFSADLQAIIERASKIAALPIQQLQNQQSALISKKQSLTALNSNLQNLTSAVAKLGELGHSRSLAVSSSNANRVTVINNGVTSANSYQITEITSVAKAASETTLTGLGTADTTAVDTDNALELVVGSQTYALDLSGGKNNLNGLRDAINSSGAGVTATVLNTGSSHYLSVTSNATGARALQVRTTAGDALSNILGATNQGANAIFKLNGLDVSQSDNVVAGAIPGLTFTIVEKTAVGETVTLTASSSRNALSAGITDFVQAYNATREKINLQIGQNAGLLSGDPIVGEVSRLLRQVNGYQGSGGVKSLSELGIDIDKTGVMSFNSTKFYSLGSGAIESAFDFLGSQTTGFGGLSRKIDQLSNPVTGFIRTQQLSYDATDLRLGKQVATLAERITRSQEVLQLKLQQADSLLAGLQSQQNALEASIKSVNYSLYGKNG